MNKYWKWDNIKYQHSIDYLTIIFQITTMKSVLFITIEGWIYVIKILSNYHPLHAVERYDQGSDAQSRLHGGSPWAYHE